jgi:trigger factor
MNVTIEDLAPCRKRLRIEVPADRVTAEYEKVATDFTRTARLPGFRPGKAPRAVILKKYQKEIEGEVQRTLVPKAYREACEKRNLKVVSYPDMEDVNYQPGISLSFSTVVETAPEFALPAYKGLSVKAVATEVTDDDVKKASEGALSQFGKFVDAAGRALATDDFAVVTYSGAVEGKPVAEIAPQARQLAGGEGQWIAVRPDYFLPGFTDALIGQQIGEKRTVTVTFPQDLGIEALQGKTGTYEVELTGIKVREIPELTDELAQQIAQVPAAEFPAKVRASLQQEKERNAKTEQKRELSEKIAASVAFDLPEGVVREETNDVVYDIVSENQNRGVPAEVLEEKKQEIFDNAARSAKEMVKLNFILRRIAEEEKIAVTNDDLSRYVTYMAMQQQQPVEKLAKQLSESDGLAQVERRLLAQKVMDFILEQAKVEQA